MANMHDYGDLVRCSVVFTNSAGSAVDPDNIYFQYRDPSFDVVSYTYGVDAELVKDGVGNYHVDVSVNETGKWWYRFYGLASGGGNQGSEETWFEVGPSRFA